MRKAGRGALGMALLVAAVLPLLPQTAFGGGDDILGVWLTEARTSKVEVVRCGERYCGDLVWLKQPAYPPDASDGVPGSPYLDHNNPSPDLRRVPLLGLRIMKDFTYAGGEWTGGTVYDPKNGKTYRGRIRLAAPGELELRGYVGIPLFGRTSHWSREAP